jgi:hypothetical protein
VPSAEGIAALSKLPVNDNALSRPADLVALRTPVLRADDPLKAARLIRLALTPVSAARPLFLRHVLSRLAQLGRALATS